MGVAPTLVSRHLYASKLREDAKIIKYFQSYKNMDDIHFEPFVVESPLGGDQYIISKLQENLDKTREVIANICKCARVTRSLDFHKKA